VRTVTPSFSTPPVNQPAAPLPGRSRVNASRVLRDLATLTGQLISAWQNVSASLAAATGSELPRGLEIGHSPHSGNQTLVSLFVKILKESPRCKEICNKQTRKGGLSSGRCDLGQRTKGVQFGERLLNRRYKTLTSVIKGAIGFILTLSWLPPMIVRATEPRGYKSFVLYADSV
jgi:hypothetical protein